MAESSNTTEFTAGKVNEITDQTYETFVAQPGVTLLDVWAIWCGPCKMIAPIVEDLAEELNGKLNVGKLDADKYIDLVRQYGVMSIPTLLLFKDGQHVDTMIGFQPKALLLNKIQRHLPAEGSGAN